MKNESKKKIELKSAPFFGVRRLIIDCKALLISTCKYALYKLVNYKL